MVYDESEEVKDVDVTFLVKVKAKMTLIGADYNKSDGTDAGAFAAAFEEGGIPYWSEMQIHKILSVQDSNK